MGSLARLRTLSIIIYVGLNMCYVPISMAIVSNNWKSKIHIIEETVGKRCKNTWLQFEICVNRGLILQNLGVCSYVMDASAYRGSAPPPTTTNGPHYSQAHVAANMKVYPPGFPVPSSYLIHRLHHAMMQGTSI